MFHPIGCVKHLNPRQGITTLRSCIRRCLRRWCETPKSPPGDYNAKSLNRNQTIQPLYYRVKHLNPRQGITTLFWAKGYGYAEGLGVKHLNPRQGITTQLTHST